MATQTIYRELYTGVTLKEVRIFIIEKCREYYQAGLGFPQNDIIVDDCFLKFYNMKECKLLNRIADGIAARWRAFFLVDI